MCPFKWAAGTSASRKRDSICVGRKYTAGKRERRQQGAWNGSLPDIDRSDRGRNVNETEYLNFTAKYSKVNLFR